MKTDSKNRKTGPKVSKQAVNVKPKGKYPKTAAKVTPTFSGFVKQLSQKEGKASEKGIVQSAPLAHLQYQEELQVKNRALDAFWHHFKLPGKPEAVIPSPRYRRYRTTSKRRAALRGGQLYLLFGDEKPSKQKRVFSESALEPVEHGRIYAFLQKKISDPAFKLLAGHLNYIVIRGSYAERAVIFNVDTMNGPLVRKLKIIAASLQKFDEGISGIYIYPGPSGSDYYLEDRQPVDLLHFKKIAGKGFLSVVHGPCRFSFHATSFSQVNESMVPVMLEQVKQLLAPEPGEDLVDLYCGYGLFSHYLASDYGSVLGIDAEGPSIRSAMQNKKTNTASSRTRFLAKRITGETISEIRPSVRREAILLDPPRKGVADGVIEALCRRFPHRVLHIHCGVDQIPASISQWKEGGFQVQRIVPLDMFPGTANLEVLIFLEPAR